MIVETLCANCKRYFSRIRSPKGGGRAARYCSERCKQAAYRNRMTFAKIRSRYDCSADHAGEQQN
jgi:hypothetical protein